MSSAFSISAPAPAIIQLHWGRGVLGSVLFTGPRASSPRPKVQTPCVEACRLLYKYWVAVSGQRLQNLSSHVCVLQFVCKFYTYFIRPRRVKHQKWIIVCIQQQQQCYYVIVSIVVVEASVFLLSYRTMDWICFWTLCPHFWSTKIAIPTVVFGIQAKQMGKIGKYRQKFKWVDYQFSETINAPWWRSGWVLSPHVGCRMDMTKYK